MAKLTLILGNKNYSSWSLRAWLVLARVGVPFEEIVVPLDRPDTRTQILAHSPSGRVPALRDGDFVIWDSLAIAEYVAEKFPQARLWPADDRARAFARSVSAEMHSGFAELRKDLWMAMKQSWPTVEKTTAVLADVARVLEIWRECRNRFGQDGPFLFGAWTIADAMYAPVVSRFHTYAVDVDPNGKQYMDAVQADPLYQKWLAGARAETYPMHKYER